MMSPLVLLHPLGADHTFWRPVEAQLRPNVSLSLDMPGHGESPLLPVGAGVTDFADWVFSELDRRHVSSCILVGVSLGGLVAQSMAGSQPERIEGLVLADTVPSYPPTMRDMWLDRAATARSQGTESLVPLTLDMWFTKTFAEANGPEVTRAVRTLTSMSDEGYARACEMLRAADVTSELQNITAPVEIVCGIGDGPAFLEAAAHMESAVPRSNLTWLDGKHAVAIERAAEFADILVRFLGASQGDHPAGASRR